MCYMILGKLFDELRACFRVRATRKQELRKIFNEYYFFASCKVIADIEKKCRDITCPVNNQLIKHIANQVMNDLAPSYGAAGGFDRSKVRELCGDEMVRLLDEFVGFCKEIDFNVAPYAAVPFTVSTILPKCLNARLKWDEVIDCYLKLVCPFGWWRSRREKKIMADFVTTSIPRHWPIGE